MFINVGSGSVQGSDIAKAKKIYQHFWWYQLKTSISICQQTNTKKLWCWNGRTRSLKICTSSRTSSTTIWWRYQCPTLSITTLQVAPRRQHRRQDILLTSLALSCPRNWALPTQLFPPSRYYVVLHRAGRWWIKSPGFQKLLQRHLWRRFSGASWHLGVWTWTCFFPRTQSSALRHSGPMLGCHKHTWRFFDEPTQIHPGRSRLILLSHSTMTRCYCIPV